MQDKTGRPFPQDPHEQLRLAINAVFESWWAKKAVDYRRIHRLPDDWGTAVTVMAMVFGNLGPTSGTGVCFSRDPSSGERRFFGEFLVNAQGEDVVAGIRTPEPIEALKTRMPAVYRELTAIKDRLEQHYRDMQDIEFTVQEGTLYILQTRVREADGGGGGAHRGGDVREGEAHRSGHRAPAGRAGLAPPAARQDGGPERPLHRASPRVCPPPRRRRWGRSVFDPEKAVDMALREEAVILVRAETSPEDVAGMHAAQGVLTSRGGLRPTRRWWHAAGASAAWSARATWWWTRRTVSSGPGARSCARGR